MKTYIHPIIKMPAGNVEVKFYDKNKSGEEILPDCIMEIGDTEEGFDYSYGEYNAPTCDFTIWNKDNLINNLMDTETLLISVDVDDENYFFGYVDIESVKPNDDFFYEYNFTALGLLSSLQFYSNEQLNLDRDAIYTNEKFKAGTILKLFAKFMGLDDNVLYNCKTDFITATGLTGNLPDLIIPKLTWDIKNCYELLNVMRRDFSFYPSVVLREGKHKLLINEEDNSQNIVALPAVKNRRPFRKYVIKQLVIKIDNLPDGMDESDIKYSSEVQSIYYGDDVEIDMQHTNIKRSLGTYITQNNIVHAGYGIDILVANTDAFPDSGNAKIIRKSDNAEIIISYTSKLSTAFQGCLSGSTFALSGFDDILLLTNGATTDAGNRIYLSSLDYSGHEIVTEIRNDIDEYSSLQLLVFEKINGKYFANNKWYTFQVRGIKGIKNNVAKMEYLMPAYRFPYEGNEFYIHSVSKSLMRNECEVLALITDKE